MYEIFERLCRERGVTPYKVCKQTGITTATISNWKAGRYVPKTDKMQKIADFFGVTIEYLTMGEDPVLNKASSVGGGDVTDEVNKILFELDRKNGKIIYNGKPLDDRQVAVLRNAMEIAFENLKLSKR